MIRKALLTTLTALFLYSALIYFCHRNITRTGQTVGQRNVVKLEDYRYEAADQYRDLIVGSSMSERLIADSIGNRTYNLAMPGLSAQAGFDLIQEHKHQPGKLYVESNTLLSATTADQLSEGHDSPTWRLLKEYLPFMRQKYQPVGVFKAFLRDLKYGKSQFVYNEAANQVDTVFRHKAIDLWISEHNPPPDYLFQQQVRYAWARLMALQRRGTKIILFEVPADLRVQRLPFPRSIRAALLDSCRANGIPFIIPRDTDAYQTTDGVHLTNSECSRYMHYLCDQLRQHGTQPSSNHLTIR